MSKVVCLVALTGLLFARPAEASLILVDDFGVAQGPVTDTTADPNDPPGTNSNLDIVSGPGILGATRTTSILGSLGVFEAAGGSGIFSSEREFDSVTGETAEQAQVLLGYGSRDGSNDLNLDLTSFVSAGGIVVDVAGIGTPPDAASFVNIFLSTAGGDQGSLGDPNLDATGQIFVPFSSFFDATVNPVDFADVDRLTFEFIHQFDSDGSPLTIDSISIVSSPPSTPIPEPSSLACLLTLGLGVGAARRRIGLKNSAGRA